MTRINCETTERMDPSLRMTKVNLRHPQRSTVCRWLKFREDAISAESGESA